MLAAICTSALSPAGSPGLAQSAPPLAAPLVQPVGPGASLDVTPAGTPIVNIAAPDKDGVSSNLYTALSAGKEGLIFNNSPATGQSAIGGFVLANPALVGARPAQLILNEVTGGVRTALGGPLEVFGGTARLVIANPAGITCDGCGFINTARVSLAAANVAWGPDGAFAGFRPASGDVTISGQGLLAGNVDYFDIIAAATHINANLYARDLVIAAGDGGFDDAARSATATPGGQAAPRVAIDSAALGGMYANRIRLVGTGAGVGINLAGTVAALDGPLLITADGAIALARTLSSRDLAITSGQDQVRLADQAYAGGALAISGRAIVQSGGFAGALGAVRLQAAETVSVEGTGFYAGLDDSGSLIGAAELTVSAPGAIAVGGATLAASGNLRLDGGALGLASGGVIDGSSVSLAARGRIELAGALGAAGDARVTADELILSGRFGATGAAVLSARQLTLAGQITGLAHATVTAAQAIDVTASGSIATNGTLTLSAPTVNGRGTLQGGDGVSLAAASLTLGGTLRSGGALALTSSGEAALTGTIAANGTGRLAVGGATLVSGTLAVAGALAIETGELDLNGGIEAGGALSLTATGALRAAHESRILTQAALAIEADAASLGGTVAANGALRLTARTLGLAGTMEAGGDLIARAGDLSLSGRVAAAGNATFTAQGAAEVAGTVSALGDLSLGAERLETGSAAQVLAGGALALTAAQALTQDGTVAGRNLTVSAPRMTLSGTLAASAAIVLAATTSLTQAGTVSAGGDLALSADSLVLSGKTIGAIQGGRAGVSLTGRAISLAATSDLQSGATLDIASREDLVSDGTILALGSASLAAQGSLTQNAALSGGGVLDLLAGARLDQDGSIAAVGPIRLAARVIDNTGRIASDGALTLDGQTAVGSTGSLTARDQLSLTAPSLDLTGVVATNDRLALAASSLNLDGAASGIRGITATLENLSLASTGVLRSGTDLDLSLARLGNAGLIAAEGTLSLATRDAIANDGQLISGGRLTLASGGDLGSAGRVQAGTDLFFSVAGRARLAGTMLADRSIEGRGTTIDLAGTLAAQDRLALTASGALTLASEAAVYARGGVALAGQSLSSAGNLVSDGALDLAAQGTLGLGGSVQARGVAAVAAGGELSLAGTLVSGGALSLAAPSISLPGRILANGGVTIGATDSDLVLAGTIQAAGPVSLTAARTLTIGSPTNPADSAPASTAPVSTQPALALPALVTPGLATPALAPAASTAASASALAGTASTGSTPAATASLSLEVPTLPAAVPGSLASNEATTLQASEIRLYGQVAAKGDLALAAAHLLTIAGSVWSDGAISGELGGLALAREASLTASGPLTLHAAGSVTNLGTIASNTADVTLTLGGSLSGSGTGHAAGRWQVNAGGDYNLSGALSAATIALSARDITLSGSTTAETGLSLAGADIALSAGSSTQSGGALTITANGHLALAGTVLGTGATSLAGASGIALAGSANIQSGGTLSLAARAGPITSDGSSTIASLGDLTLAGDTLALAGTMATNGALALTARGDLTASGTISTLGPAAIAAPGTLALGGTLTTGSDLTLSGGNAFIDGAIRAGSNLALTTGSLSVRGSLHAGGGLSLLTSANLVMLARPAGPDLSGTTGPSLSAAGSLSLTSGGTMALAGDIGAGHDLTLAAGGDLVSQARLVSHRAIALRGEMITLGGPVNAGTNLAVTARQTLTGSGTLAAGWFRPAADQPAAGGAVTLEGAAIRFTGALSGNGSLTARSTNGALALTGDTALVGATRLTSAGELTLGALTTGAGLTIRADGQATLDGPLGSHGEVDMLADAIILGGALGAVGPARLETRAGDLNLVGPVAAQGALSLVAARDLALSGTAVTDGLLTLRAGRNAALGAAGVGHGGIAASVGGQLTISASGALVADGNDAAGGQLTIAAAALENAGTLSAQGELTATITGALFNRSGGTVVGGNGLGLSTGSLVNARGAVLASNAALALSVADGLCLDGHVGALGNVTLRAGSVELTGIIDPTSGQGGVQAGGDLSLTSVTGGITAAPAATLRAAGNVTLTSAAGLTLSGDLATNGSATLSAAGTLAASGRISGLGALALQGAALNLDGEITSGGELVATAAGPAGDRGTLAVTGTLRAARALTLTGGASALGEGAVLASGDMLHLRSASLTSRAALSGAAGLTVTTDGDATIGGSLVAGSVDAAGRGTSSAAITLTTGGLLALTGEASATGSQSLSARGNLVTTGRLVALGDISITGEALTAGGFVTANGALAITARGIMALGGELKGLGGVGATSGGSLTLGGTLGSNGSVGIAAAGILTQGEASRLGANGDITLDAASLDLAGRIEAGGTLALTGTTGDANIRASGSLLATDLSLAAAGDVTAAGKLLGTRSLSAAVSGTLAITPGGALQAGTSDATGTITSVGTMRLGVNTAIRNAGLIFSTGTLAFDTPGLVSTGTISTGADITLRAANLSLGGTLVSLGTVDASATAGSLSLTGALEGRNVRLGAQGGDLLLTAGSRISAFGTGSAGLIQIAGDQAISALGTIAANNDVTLTVAGALRIGSDSGGVPALTSKGAVALTAGGAITLDGTVAADGNVSVRGANLAARDLTSGASLDLQTTGNITLGGKTSGETGVSIVSAAGGLTLATAALVESPGAVSLRAAGDIDQAGQIIAGRVAVGEVPDGINGAIAISSGGSFTSSGAIVSNTNGVSLSARSLALSAAPGGTGGLYAAGKVALDAPSLTLGAGAELVANGALTFTGSSLRLGAVSLLQSNQDLALTLGSAASPGAFVSAGHLVALGNLSLTVIGGSLVNQSGGGLYAGGSGPDRRGGNLVLAASRLDNAGQIVASAVLTGTGGQIAISAPTVTSAGLIHADGALTLTGSSLAIEGPAGLVESGAAIDWTLASLAIGAGATLQSTRSITLATGSFSSAGAVLSGGSIAIGSTGPLAATGTLSAEDTLSLASSGALTLGGLVAARTGLTLRGTSVNLGGTVQAWNSETPGTASLAVTATAGALSLTGRAVSSSTLNLSAAGALTLAPGGSAYANGTLTANADTIAILATPGTSLESRGNMALSSSRGLVMAGSLVADGSIALSDAAQIRLGAGSLVSAGGRQGTPEISASTVSLAAPVLVAAGTLATTGNLALSTGALTVNGQVAANGEVALGSLAGGPAPTVVIGSGATLASYLGSIDLGTIASLDLGGTLVSSTGALRLTTARTAIGTTGFAGAGGNVALTTSAGGSVTVDGSLVAGGNLTLTGGTLAVGSGGLVRAGGALSFMTSDWWTGSRPLVVGGTSYDVAGTPVSALVRGTLQAGGDLTLTMPGALVFSETSQALAGWDINLVAGHVLVASPFGNGRYGLLAGRNVTIGTSAATPPGGLGARGLVLDGVIQAAGALTIEVDGDIISTARSVLAANTSLSLKGSALRLEGLNTGGDLVSLVASGAAPAGVAATLTPGEITLAGATASQARVALTANAATISQTGSITTQGAPVADVTLGRDVGDAANIDLRTQGNLVSNGAIWSDGLISLKSLAGNVINNAAGANGGITATSLVAQADGGSLLNQAGALKAANAAFYLAGDFVNSGTLSPAENWAVHAANIRNSGLLAAAGNLTLGARGDLVNTGTIFAGNTLNLSAGGTLRNDYVGDDQGNGAHGLILAQNDIVLTAHDVLNRSATIQSLAGNIDVSLTGGGFTNTVRTLTLATVPGSGFLIDDTGRYAGGFSADACGTTKTLSKTSFTQTRCGDGTLRPGDAVSTTTFINYGPGLGYDTIDDFYTYYASTYAAANTGGSLLSAAGSITITAGSGTIANRNSQILAGGTIRLSTTGEVSNVADLLITRTVSGNTVTLANAALAATPTRIQAGGDVVIAAGHLTNGSAGLVTPDTFSGNQLVRFIAPGLGAAERPPTAAAGIEASASAGQVGTSRPGIPPITSGTVGPTGASAQSGTAPTGVTLAGAGQGTARSGATGLSGSSAIGAADSSLATVSTGGGLAPYGGATVLSALATGGPGQTATAGPTGLMRGAAVEPIGAVDTGEGGRLGFARVDPGTAAVGKAGEVGSGDGGREPKLVTATVSLTAAPQIGTVELGSLGSQAPLPAASGVTGDTTIPAPLVAGLTRTFDGAGLPVLANQGFGTFLGGFLASFNLTGNAPALFTYRANPNSAYLFTTSAALSSEAALYDSQWFFDRLGEDRATTFTRLGDGFFEALLVARQVQAATGTAQLSSYGSALEQYEGLLKRSLAASGKLELALGVALTDSQVAALTEPLVWYVSQEIAGRRVLVPVLYLAAGDSKVISQGAVIAGTNVLARVSGRIDNSATITASQVAALTAGGDIVNALGGRIAGGSVMASAGRDIVLGAGSAIAATGTAPLPNPGGTIVPGGLVSLRAGGSMVGETLIARTFQSGISGQTTTRGVGEAVLGAAISASGAIALTADKDIRLSAATISSGGATSLLAGGGIVLGGATTTSRTARTGPGLVAAAQTATFTGTRVTAGGPVSLTALTGSLSMIGSTVRTTDPAAGMISLYGAGGIEVIAAQNTASSNTIQQTGKRSSVTTVMSSLTNSLATIDAAGALEVTTPGALSVRGGTLNAGGALTVNAGSVAVSGVIDQIDLSVSTYAKTKGLLSSTTTRTTTVTSDQTAVASTLSGNTLTITTPGAVTVNGANLVASQGLAIEAGGPVSIGTLATTDSQSQTVSVKKSGLSLSGSGLFLGVARTSTANTGTSVTQNGSLVGSDSGPVSITSLGALSVTGSKVATSGDVLLAGRSIDLAHALDVTDTARSAKSSSVGLSIGAQSQILQSATNLLDAARIATSSGNDRVTAVAGLAGVAAGVNTVNGIKDLAGTLRKGEGQLGISVGINFGISQSRSTSQSHEESVVASQVTGDRVTLLATGEGPGGTIRVTGSNLAAASDLTLAARGPITLAAAQETASQSGSAKSSGVNLGVNWALSLDKKQGVEAGGPTLSLGMSSATSRYAGSQVSNVASTLAAGATTRITTPGALGIDGATVSGGTVLVEAGSLAIASRQDTASYRAQNRSSSAGVSVNLATGQVSVNGNLSQGRQQGDFASVATQAGILAGAGGFGITVAGETDLTGGVIASEAEAARNSLTTGTLTTRDIRNAESWTASQLSLGGGLTFNTAPAPASSTPPVSTPGGDTGRGSGTGSGTTNAIGTDRSGQTSPTGATRLPGIKLADGVSVSPTLPLPLSASGSQQGTTASAIAPGSITITSADAASRQAAQTISRDPATANGALTRQFTDQQRAEIAQGFAAAQILATETQAFLARKAQQQAEARAQAAPAEAAAVRAGVLADQNGQPLRDARGNLIALNPAAQAAIDAARPQAERAQALADAWGAGGAGNLALTALSTAAGGNVTGSLGSLAQSAAVNVLQGLATRQVKEIADSFTTQKDAQNNPIPTATSETVRSALQGIVACAGSTAGGSGQCSGAAMGAAASVVLNRLGPTPGTDAAGQPLPLEAQQARAALVGTIVTAIAQATGQDAGAALAAARIETTNNALVPIQSFDGNTRTVCTEGEPQCNNAPPFDKWSSAPDQSSERKEYEVVRGYLGPDATEAQITSVLEAVYWGGVPAVDAYQYVLRGYDWKGAQALWEQNKALGPGGIFSPLHTDNWGAYQVAAGDTLSAIAARIPGLRMADLLTVNPTIDPNNLQPGQDIRLPTQAYIDRLNAAKLIYVRLTYALEQNGGKLPANVDTAHMPPVPGEAQAVAQLNAQSDKLAAVWLATHSINPSTTTLAVLEAAAVASSNPAGNDRGASAPSVSVSSLAATLAKPETASGPPPPSSSPPLAPSVPTAVLAQQAAQDALVASQQSNLKAAIDSNGATGKGQAFNDLGARNEDITNATLKQIEGAGVNSTGNSVGAGTGSNVDYKVSLGGNAAYIESKYSITTLDNRIVNQLTNAVRTANAAGDGSFVVLQVAKAPTAGQLNALKAAVGDQVYNQVKIVSTQFELYNVVKSGLKPPK